MPAGQMAEWRRIRTMTCEQLRQQQLAMCGMVLKVRVAQSLFNVRADGRANWRKSFIGIFRRC
jgi:hypothetical protein